ncbi:hypothetical protein OG921_01215 [Aldersonia sp. NBC_00410]|nr:hypothetical protein [Aldersonia sp. NBC_00410]
MHEPAVAAAQPVDAGRAAGDDSLRSVFDAALRAMFDAALRAVWIPASVQLG